MNKSVLAALLLLAAIPANALGPYPGYTLITPLRSTETFLIDIDGNTIQSWHGDNGAGHTVYLLPDRSVLRGQGDPAAPLGGGGGAGGHLQRIDANDNVVWDYFFSSPDHQHHHDLAPMPNGHVLVIAWEPHSRDEAIALGRLEGDDMRTTLVAELEPVGTDAARVVWEWRIWDHLIQDVDPSKPNYGVVGDHPERIDINLGPGRASWDHANFIDYNAHRDEIVLSLRGLNEFIVIDHSTTTAEAAGRTGGRHGRGGDILYRWGNPANYRRGAGEDQIFFGVHGAAWIDPLLPGAGGIMAFNNGNRPGNLDDYSSVVEVQPPRDRHGNYVLATDAPFGPAEPRWRYEAGPGFYSLRYGSAFRMPNGNTLICEGAEGNIFEVTPEGERVWVYVEPIGRGVFSAERYWDEVALDGAFDILPGDCTNVLDLDWFDGAGNGGVMVTSLLGSDILDVSFVDPETIRLEGVAPVLSSISHAGGAECGVPDEHADLMLKFRRRDIAAMLGDAVMGSDVILSLSGALRDGSRFTAQDHIRVGRRRADGPMRAGGHTGTSLGLATPNPFNPATTIRYRLSTSGPVLLAIYGAGGRVVRTLVSESQAVGEHSVRWDGRDDSGRPVASGVYFYCLDARGFNETRKMVLMK